MSLILKNTTISNIELVNLGVEIPASGSFTVEPTNLLILATDDSVTELTPLINSGDIVVNDGIQDLTAKRGIDRLSYPLNISPSNTLYVATSGSDSTGDGSFTNPFATLTGVKSALDAGDFTPSSSNPLNIKLDSGVFTQAPVDFSSYSFIRIEGDYTRTRISASNASADLLTLGKSTAITNLSFEGVTGASNYYIKFSGTSTGGGTADNLYFNAGSNGITMVNTTGSLSISCLNIIGVNLSGSMVTVNDNTIMTINTSSFTGNATSTIIFNQNGSGEFYVNNCRVSYADKALEVNGNTGRIELIGLDIGNSNQVLDQNGTCTIQTFGGNYDLSTSSITDTSVIQGFFFNELDGEKQLRVIDELSVGIPNRGSESTFGQGDTYTVGMQVWTYNGTTYASELVAAASTDSSTFTFPSTSVDDAIYVTTAFDTASPLMWYGLEINTTTAASLGSGDIVFEYYNGTSWVEFNHMMVKASSTNESFANSKFEQTGKFQVYFSNTLESDWAVNDPVSLGVSLYWVRFRVDGSAITTAPVFEQFKVHTNRVQFESNGVQKTYGLARAKKKFPVSFSSLDSAPGQGPSNQSIYLSDTLAIDVQSNSFPFNATKSTVFVQNIPFDLDTSSPINLTLSYFVDNSSSGDINLRVTWATSATGEGICKNSSGAPTTALNERTSSNYLTVGAGEDDTIKTANLSLEIPEALSQNSNGNPESALWIEIERKGSDSGDDYNGNFIIIDLALFYTSWRTGGYSGEFS